MQEKTNEPREIPISFDSADGAEPIVEDIGDPRPVDPVVEAMVQNTGQREDSTAVEEATDEPQPNPSRPSRSSQLQSQIDVLLTERASLYDKLLRRQAEFDNYRKRVERERAELYQHGREDVLIQFLPVVDNFERALSSLEES